MWSMDGIRRMLGRGPGRCLLALAWLLALAPSVLASQPRTLAALERDIAATMAHAAVLRERLVAEGGGDAARPAPGHAGEIAGIADGGSRSSLAALRLAARAVDRRIETLRAGLPELPPERAEVMLVMRSALGRILWTIEDLPLAMTDAGGGVPGPTALLDRLDRSLADLAAATSAMATLTR